MQQRYLFCNKVIVLLATSIVMNRTEETTQDFGSITTSLQSIQIMSYYVIPKDTVLIFKKICNLALVPCFIVIGLLFNSFCFALFYRIKKKSATVILLLGLSITDILIVINAGINSLMYTSLWYNSHHKNKKAVPQGNTGASLLSTCDFHRKMNRIQNKQYVANRKTPWGRHRTRCCC